MPDSTGVKDIFAINDRSDDSADRRETVESLLRLKAGDSAWAERMTESGEIVRGVISGKEYRYVWIEGETYPSSQEEQKDQLAHIRAGFYNGSGFWLPHPPHNMGASGWNAAEVAILKDAGFDLEGTVLCPCGKNGAKDLSGGNSGFDPKYAERYGMSPYGFYGRIRGLSPTQIGRKAPIGLIRFGPYKDPRTGRMGWIMMAPASYADPTFLPIQGNSGKPDDQPKAPATRKPRGTAKTTTTGEKAQTARKVTK